MTTRPRAGYPRHSHDLGSGVMALLTEPMSDLLNRVVLISLRFANLIPR
jgi:hypothetical protein